MSLTESQNSLRFLKFVESKQGSQYGKHQSSTIEERCKEFVYESNKILQSTLGDIRHCLKSLKSEIIADD